MDLEASLMSGWGLITTGMEQARDIATNHRSISYVRRMSQLALEKNWLLHFMNG